LENDRIDWFIAVVCLLETQGMRSSHFDVCMAVRAALVTTQCGCGACCRATMWKLSQPSFRV
jgi:hypothetical protein